MGVPGLRLNLGGAPLTPHVIDGVPGLYWPTHPTPIDIIDGVDEAKAKELHSDPGVPLTLEQIKTEADAERHREMFRQELRNAAVAGGDLVAPVGAESDVRQAQIAAIAPEPKPIPTKPEASADGKPEKE